MSFDGVTERTRRYLEEKYDVKLSDVRIETPVVGNPRYTSSTKTAYVPYVSSQSSLSLLLSCGLIIVPDLFSRHSTVTHQLAHAVSGKLTEPDASFKEPFSIHEEFTDPNIPGLDMAARRIAGFFFPKNRVPPHWVDVFKWMDDPKREGYIDELRRGLDDTGSGHAAAGFCGQLYQMKPRQFVEEHRLLRGLRFYLRSGNKAYLERAFEDFRSHGGDKRVIGKYANLI